MDRIETYVKEAFAKFKDLSEIQAQKEEMSDHLRDRIRDAISQGASEKKAFEAVTADLSDSMGDLEQTLSEFLRDEYRQENIVKPKPETKEIHVNLFRYHGTFLTLFVEALVVLTVLLSVGHQYFQLPGISQGVDANFNVQGILYVLIWTASFHVIISIIRYAVAPLKTKRIPVGPLGIVSLIPVLETVLIALVLPLCIFFAFISNNSFFDPIILAGLVAAWLLILNLLEICWLYLTNGRKYEIIPRRTSNFPLFKTMVVLLALVFPLFLHQAFSTSYWITQAKEERASIEKERTAHKDSYQSLFNSLRQERVSFAERIGELETELKYEKENRAEILRKIASDAEGIGNPSGPSGLAIQLRACGINESMPDKIKEAPVESEKPCRVILKVENRNKKVDRTDTRLQLFLPPEFSKDEIKRILSNGQYNVVGNCVERNIKTLAPGMSQELQIQLPAIPDSGSNIVGKILYNGALENEISLLVMPAIIVKPNTD